MKMINRHLVEKASLRELKKGFNVFHGWVCSWINKHVEFCEDALEKTCGGNKFAALATRKSLTEVEQLL